MAMPLYVPGRPEPAVVLRVGRIFLEHPRRGFFRIGLFWEVVAEQVEIELRWPEGAARLLPLAARALDQAAMRRSTEWRQLRITGPQGQPLLTAARVRVGEHGVLKLLDGVTIGSPEAGRHLPNAELRLEGEQAGVVTSGSDLPVRLNLFSNQQAKPK